MEVNRRVVETITRERLPFDPSAAKIGRINADSLQAHLNNFKYVQLLLIYYFLFFIWGGIVGHLGVFSRHSTCAFSSRTRH